MVSSRVLVVGGGVAGVAAAYAAALEGASVELFDAGPGATALSGGALDARPWSQLFAAAQVLGVAPKVGAIDPRLQRFSQDLGLWQLGQEGQEMCWLATSAGTLRPAVGHDRALLDLRGLGPGARVVLPRIMCGGWNADLIAHGLQASAREAGRDLRFDAMDADLHLRTAERSMAALEFATLHDDRQRCVWLGKQLQLACRRCGGADAILVGPWLGTTLSCSMQLRDALNMPIGEVVAQLGGPAGMRFENARDDLCARRGIAIRHQRVLSLQRGEGEWYAETSARTKVVADSVVVAVGGLASGGVVYEPAEHAAGADMPAYAKLPFRLSLEIRQHTDSTPLPLKWAALGEQLDVGGSMHGLDLERVAWPQHEQAGLLEAVGLVATRRLQEQRLGVAGEVMADRPRTILSAASTGLRAGREAANVS